MYHYSGNANASGDWGVSKNQTSLVNELGNELIVRDGRWHLIEGGAQFVPLKKGDIVFNHKFIVVLHSDMYEKIYLIAGKP